MYICKGYLNVYKEKMYILNKYILKKFLSSFFLAMGLIILIVIVFDVSEKIDDFINKKAPLHLIIFQYYLNFIPFFINMFSSLFTFVSVIFFTSKMASNTEIIAILSTGVSFKRLLVPYLYGALIIALMTFLFTNFLIPVNNQYRLKFEAQYIKNAPKSMFSDIHLQLDENTHVYAESFNSQYNTASHFTLERFDENNEVIQKIAAGSIVYDTITGLWQCNSYTIRNVDGLNESLTFIRDTVVEINLIPKDFNIKSEKTETMNLFQLNEFIERERLRGSPMIKSYMIDKYERLLSPLMVIIMTFIGVAVSSRKVRGGMGLHLAIGITIAFSYVMFSQVSTVFSVQGNMSPLLSVLLPSIFYGILAIFLLRTTPK